MAGTIHIHTITVGIIHIMAHTIQDIIMDIMMDIMAAIIIITMDTEMYIMHTEIPGIQIRTIIRGDHRIIL